MAEIGKTAIVGCGNIGGAIAAGLVRSGEVAAADIIGCDFDQSKLQELADELGISTSTDAEAAVRDAANVIVAVKPNLVNDVLSSLKSSLGKTEGQLVVSVAAGVGMNVYKRLVPKGVGVVRVMPNLPITVGAGSSGVYAEAADDAERVKKIFDTLGNTVVVAKEAELDCVTGLAGSGPGYVFLLIEALQQGGVAAGLSPQAAHALAAHTVLGAAKMVVESGEHPAVLRDRVTTAGGTTIAGIEVLEAGGVRAALMEAVLAASERARDIGEQMARS